MIQKGMQIILHVFIITMLSSNNIDYTLDYSAIVCFVKYIILNIFKAHFSSGCNGTCRPDLKLDVTSDPQDIIYGSTVEIIVKLKVINIDEPSHGTRITIYTSENTQYLGFYQPQGFVTELGYCNQELDQNNKTVIYCDLQQKSLYQQQQWMLNVRFNVSRDTLDGENIYVYDVDRNVKLDVAATSTSNDKDMSDNRVKLTVPVKMHSELELSGLVIQNC